MRLYTSRKARIWHAVKLCLPVLFLAVCLGTFIVAIRRTGEDPLKKQQETLSQTLVKSAVRTYAMTGRYPESLAEITAQYGISYDPSHFVVEYLPSGANLFPQIYVIAIGGKP